MLRKSKVVIRFAKDYLRYPYYYVEERPTIAEVARNLKVSREALKRFLLSNSIPGLYVELSVRTHRGRELPAYRIYLSDWMVTYSYLKELIYGEE